MTAGLLSYITIISEESLGRNRLNMPTKMLPLPSFDRLNELLVYDPEDGKLIRKIDRSNMKSGDLAGCIKTNRNGRREWKVMIDGKYYISVRIIWALYHRQDPGILTIDHINQNPLDNRIVNLRLATAHDQAMNMSITSSSTATRHRGIMMQSHKNDRRQRPQWRGKILIAGKNYSFGSVAVDSINDEPPRWLIDRASRLYALRDDPSITDNTLIDLINGLKRVPLSV